MTGIFPSNGVAAGNTTNALTTPDLVSGAEAKWYAERCNPRISAAALNAIISEILNFTDISGISYDPSRLDNMAQAISATAGSAASITTLQNSVATLTTKVNSLQSTVTGYSSRVAALEAANVSKQAAIDALVADVAALQAIASVPLAELTALMTGAGQVYDSTVTNNLVNAIKAIVENGTLLTNTTYVPKVGAFTRLLTTGITAVSDGTFRNLNMSLERAHPDEMSYDTVADELTVLKAGTYNLSWNADVRGAWDGVTGTGASFSIGLYTNATQLALTTRTIPNTAIGVEHRVRYLAASGAITYAAGDKISLKYVMTGGTDTEFMLNWFDLVRIA